MTLEQLQEQASKAPAIGAKIKFVLDGNAVMVDGTGNTNEVKAEDGEADCTITTTMETMQAVRDGDLNPMMAVMSGKIKISGDMGLAMKLQSLIG